MKKIKIKLVSIGHLPIEFQSKKILRWNSSIFEVVGDIDNYSLRCDSDRPDWVFSDQLIEQQLPSIIALVNVPIENNWYARRLGNNRVVFTFHEIKDILEFNNIPLENVIYRILYAYTLLYKRSGDKIPNFGEVPGYTHDETRGCLFDMNGIKTDILASCHKPIICDECQERLRQEKVSNDLIIRTQKEIKKIQRDLYYRIFGFIKKHPAWALVLSSIFAIILGTVSSLIASLFLK
jgi:hypothetical protein